MTRKEELIRIICKADQENAIRAQQLIDEVVFIEERLIELKKLPFINVNPKNAMQQKATPAAKLYKELLQQYNNSLKLLLKISGDIGDAAEDSPLRKWARERLGDHVDA